MMFVHPATANARLRLKTASRVNAALTQRLGQGIDIHRMLGEPLYARDVLLVCDALRDHAAGGASALAQQFRQAARAMAKSAGGANVKRKAERDNSFGFSASRILASFFGPFATRATLDARGPHRSPGGRTSGAVLAR